MAIKVVMLNKHKQLNENTMVQAATAIMRKSSKQSLNDMAMCFTTWHRHVKQLKNDMVAMSKS